MSYRLNFKDCNLHNLFTFLFRLNKTAFNCFFLGLKILINHLQSFILILRNFLNFSFIERSQFQTFLRDRNHSHIIFDHSKWTLLTESFRHWKFWFKWSLFIRVIPTVQNVFLFVQKFHLFEVLIRRRYFSSSWCFRSSL